MKPILKYVGMCAFFVMSLTVLNGCMLMMPAMMSTEMLKTSHSDIRENEQLVTGAVSELAANRGSYNLIELGRIETDGQALSDKKFREMIADQIATSGQLALAGSGHDHTAAAGVAGEDRPARAILDAELLRLDSRTRLELKLKDVRSGLNVWEKRFYSSPPASASSHAH